MEGACKVLPDPPGPGMVSWLSGLLDMPSKQQERDAFKSESQRLNTCEALRVTAGT